MWPEWVSSWTSRGRQTNTWVQFGAAQIHMYLDVVVFPPWPFLSLQALLCNPRIKVTGKFKVKAYASLPNDLYLREPHKQTVRRDMSQSPPPHCCKRKQRGNTKGYICKTKQSNASRLQSWKLLLEVLSDRRTPSFICCCCFGTATIKSSSAGKEKKSQTPQIRATTVKSSHRSLPHRTNRNKLFLWELYSPKRDKNRHKNSLDIFC